MDKIRFKEIWLPFSDDFLRYAESLLKNTDDAEDVVQDLYVKLWNRRHDLDAIVSCKAYGIVLLRNMCLDRLRSVRGGTADIDAAIQDPSMRDPDAQQIMITREEADRLGKAIDSLPQRQKEIMKLRYYQDMDMKEISSVTGLTQINIRVLISRAKDKIRKIYGTK